MRGVIPEPRLILFLTSNCVLPNAGKAVVVLGNYLTSTNQWDQLTFWLGRRELFHEVYTNNVQVFDKQPVKQFWSTKVCHIAQVPVSTLKMYHIFTF